MEENYDHNIRDEFEKVINEYQDQLFRFAFFRTGSLSDSQDIVQDVFVKLYQHNLMTLKIDNIKHYLFKAIANACNDYHRNKKPSFGSVEKISDTQVLQEKDASYNIEMIEEYERIEKVLKQVSNSQAETIRLRIMDNLSFVEIADLLQEPVTTVKSRFKYGIDKLKLVLHAKKDVYEL